MGAAWATVQELSTHSGRCLRSPEQTTRYATPSRGCSLAVVAHCRRGPAAGRAVTWVAVPNVGNSSHYAFGRSTIQPSHGRSLSTALPSVRSTPKHRSGNEMALLEGEIPCLLSVVAARRMPTFVIPEALSQAPGVPPKPLHSLLFRSRAGTAPRLPTFRRPRSSATPPPRAEARPTSGIRVAAGWTPRASR